MLTTIGNKIIEIRPKQIIELDSLVSHDYLILVSEKAPQKKRGKPKTTGVNNDINLPKTKT
jgi:hypothetical protein